MKRGAFSLIELLIVVLIMGVMYSLAVGSLGRIDDKVTKVTLSNLKSYLYSFNYKESVEILCLDRCSQCEIYVDGELEDTEDKLDDFLQKPPRIYRFDFTLGESEIESQIYFDERDVEKEVCFRYKIDKRGVGEQLLVEYKESIYDFSTYLSDETPIYDNISQAVDAKNSLIQKVLQ